MVVVDLRLNLTATEPVDKVDVGETAHFLILVEILNKTTGTLYYGIEFSTADPQSGGFPLKQSQPHVSHSTVSLCEE